MKEYTMSQTLFDAMLQNYEELLRAAPEDDLDPDAEVVLSELHSLRAGLEVENGTEEESTDAESPADEPTDPVEA